MANWELVIEGRQGNEDMLNVIHYQDNQAGEVDWDFIATAIRGHLEDHLQAVCGPHVTWQGITAREDVPGGVGTFYAFGAGTLTGTNGDEDQLNQSAVLVRKLTAGNVRPARGWALQGGITTRILDGASRWGSIATDAAEDFWEDIRVMSYGVGGVLQMVIKARNPAAPNTVPYNEVTAVATGIVPRTVKSRREGEGS